MRLPPAPRRLVVALRPPAAPRPPSAGRSRSAMRPPSAARPRSAMRPPREAHLFRAAALGLLLLVPRVVAAAGTATSTESGALTVPTWLFVVLLVLLFVGSFVVGVALLISPMIWPSFRSVGSPDEIIEEMGLGGHNDSAKKLLLAYDTRHGTTAITAQKIGRTLAEKGFRVDVRCIRTLSEGEVAGYDGYIVGSWIYYMRVSAATVAFLDRFKEELRQKPLAYFIVCGKLLTGSEEQVGDVLRSYLKPVEDRLPELKPLDLGMFPGGVILSKLSFWERAQMFIKMHKLGKPRMKEGVFIDDGRIDQWTTKLSTMFS